MHIHTNTLPPLPPSHPSPPPPHTHEHNTAATLSVSVSCHSFHSSLPHSLLPSLPPSPPRAEDRRDPHRLHPHGRLRLRGPGPQVLPHPRRGPYVLRDRGRCHRPPWVLGKCFFSFLPPLPQVQSPLTFKKVHPPSLPPSLPSF